MIKSHIIEAASFTQARCEFNVPAALCASMKLCDIGVTVADRAYPLDPIIGQLGIIKSITIRDNAQVLSQYDRRFASVMEYKALQQTNTKHRNILRKLYANNHGFQLENGGANAATPGNIGAGNVLGEGVVYPRVAVDKRCLSRVANTQLNSKLAVLDLRDVMGWCNAVYSGGDAALSGYMPCHMHNNMKLQIEFNIPTNVAGGANGIIQPYLIFDEVNNPSLAKEYMNATGSWTDLELEEIYLGTDATSRRFLNSFYGKTVGNLHLIPLNNGSTVVPLAPTLGNTYAANDRLNLLVNQVPLLQQAGIDSVGKRNVYLQMAVGDLCIPIFADRIIKGSGDKTNSADAANSLYEGAVIAGGTFAANSNYFSAGTLSYMALPVQSKITSLQLDLSRSTNFNATLLCFGEVMKQSQLGQGSPVVSYM